jgi:hypothetical protein
VDSGLKFSVVAGRDPGSGNGSEGLGVKERPGGEGDAGVALGDAGVALGDAGVAEDTGSHVSGGARVSMGAGLPEGGQVVSRGGIPGSVT